MPSLSTSGIIFKTLPMKIAILGAGAMGSAIGALLHKAGHKSP